MTGYMIAAVLLLLALLAGAVYIIVILALQLHAHQREIADLGLIVAAKTRQVELLHAEQALLNGRHELLQSQIRAYIVSAPKANKTHARRLAAERCMN